MKNKATCLFLFLLLAALGVSHAETIAYQFTAVDLAIANPQSPVYEIATFLLTPGEAPNLISQPPGVSLTYDNVAVDYSETVGGVVASSIDALATVTIDPDGIQVQSNKPGSFDFFAGSGGGSTWSGNPNAPTFQAGTYASADEIGDYVNVSNVNAPELPTFALLGTGLLGIAALARRKSTKNLL
jgi:hypothetical protein